MAGPQPMTAVGSPAGDRPRPLTGEPVLRLDAVTFGYPGAATAALREASLDVWPGEVVVVVGESGSGKSTLGLLAAGLFRPSRGRVVVDGLDTVRVKPQVIAGRLGLVLQNPSHQLLASTIREELALGPRNLGCAADETERRVAEAAARLDLDPVLDRHPYRVPVGARKRVTIAAVLAMRPVVLVLDEPTTGQARREARSVEAIVRDEAARGVAIVVITHDLRFAAAVADRLMVLRAGLVLAQGPARELLADDAALAAAGLEPPPLVRLWQALGAGPGGPPMTVDEGEALVRAHAAAREPAS